jgi:hypothetical protein
MNRDRSICEKHRDLLKAIKDHLLEIERTLRPASPYSLGEDSFYRFYHGSFKVYSAQKETEKMLSLLRKIGRAAGQEELNPMFLHIVAQGTGKNFNIECNINWGKQERPIIEAFFHAREMLSCALKYGNELEEAPTSLPSGWATVLYLYNMR